MDTHSSDLNRFFDLSVDLHCIAAFDGIIRRVNPVWERVLGFTPESVTGKPLQAFIHPDDWEAAAPRLARLARRSQPATFESRCQTRVGDWRWFEWSVVPAAEEQLWYASGRDITDRRRAEIEIQKLAAFPRLSPCAIFEFADDGRLTYFNDAALELARSLGEGHPEKILPRNATEIVCACLVRGEARTRVESSCRDRVLVWSFHPIPGSGIVHGYANDMTEHRAAGERIREQAALLDKAQDAIVVRDLEHRILYWNKGAERVFGWTTSEAAGRNAFEMLTPGKGEPSLTALRRVLETGDWSGELAHATKSGGEVILESRWTLVREPQGQPKSILVISTDITEKKKLETQFLRAQRLESIGTLASGIAHDLNNILAPIMMSVNLLQESLTDEHDRRLLETLRVSALRGAEMTRQILTFTRGQHGERGLVNLKHLVTEITKIGRETFPRSIRIETGTGKNLWPVMADATQIHQVLMNLCVNARDAMLSAEREGKLTVVLSNVTLSEKHQPLHPEARPGRFVRLSVIDTGIGIAPENLERIWDPFFTLKPEDQGTGLGLSTVQNIVRSHGGFVHVESQPGQGSCFEVYLPAAEASVVVTRSDAEEPAPEGRGEKILVVDDERAFQEITRAIFARYGYRVVTASDGSEALALFAQHRDDISLVLTDMMMPALDGPATIRGLHRLKPGLPVIATSGLSENESVAREFDRTLFLLKPFTTEKLLQAVDQSLRAP